MKAAREPGLGCHHNTTDILISVFGGVLMTSLIVDPDCTDDERRHANDSDPYDYHAGNRDNLATTVAQITNTSRGTRIGVDLRVVHRSDVEAGRRAVEVDANCTGTTTRDDLRPSDLSSPPADVVEPFDTGFPAGSPHYAIVTN